MTGPDGSLDTSRGDLPSYVPSERERDVLELICSGALAPTAGFEGSGGAVSLRVPAAVARDGLAHGGLLLLDPEGAAQARVYIDSTYDAGDGLSGIVGEVEPLPHDGFGSFRRLRLTPYDARHACGESYLTVPVTTPLTTEDLGAIRAAARGRPVLLLTLLGSWTPALPEAALVRATLAAAATIPDAIVAVAPVRPRGRRPQDDELVERVLANYATADRHWPTGVGPLPPEVATVVAGAIDASPSRRGLVLFFTGLSGSGKSTIAREVRDVLSEQYDRTITMLDGDVVRRQLTAGLGFSMEDRARNVTRIGWVAAELARHGATVIASPIAPLESIRQQVRAMVSDANASFVLVHVATPLEECERRDRKGLYARARAGEISDFTGISSPYEPPAAPEIRVDTTGLTVAEAVEQVIAHLADHGHLPDRVDDVPSLPYSPIGAP